MHGSAPNDLPGRAFLRLWPLTAAAAFVLTVSAATSAHADQTWIGGTGNWSTPSNWTPSTWVAGNTATFNAAAGMVTVGTQTAGGLTVNTGGYAFQSGTLKLNPGAVISLAGGTTTFASTLGLSGAGGVTITKTGAGTLALSTSNTDLGTTSGPAAWTLNAGTLAINAGNNLGANPGSPATQLTFTANGTLQFGAALATGSALETNRGFLIDNGVTATMDTQSFTVYTNNGISAQSGQTGTLNKIGSGTLYLGNNKAGTDRDDAYLRVVASAGTLALNKGSSSSVHAVGGGGLTVAGGTVTLAGSGGDQIYNAAPVTLAGGTFNTAGLSEGSVSGGAPVQGVGALTLTATSVLDLGTGASVIAFANSSASAWASGATLSVWNWSGQESGGGVDAVFFGAGGSGSTSAQLGQIAFYSDSGTTFLGSAVILSNGEIVPVPIAAATANDPFLAVNGLNVCNGGGAGDAVPLRGVNLGGWLVMEAWMVPMDSSGLADQYSALQTLDNRFGVATEQALITTYQNAWITTRDLDNIKALGMNVVRLPFWWGNLLALDGTWRADAFKQMDWLVGQAWQRGIYTILDFHGVPGGQSTSQDTGQQNQNQYWTSAGDQAQTVYLWQQVAAHYKGNPAVAGYDLINEPINAPSANNYAAVRTAYNSLYQAIRAVDPTHIIFIEGTYGNWNWSMLPPPSTYGWTNVVYEMHEYQYGSSGNAAGVETGTTNQITDFQNHASWNVPDYIGEFNDFSPGSTPTAVWQDAIQRFNANNMSWSPWAYKAIHGTSGDSWGVYDATSAMPPTPNLATDPAATIQSDWLQGTTQAAFSLTPMLQTALGAPVANPDAYLVAAGGTLSPASAGGVLANDQDINLGKSGITLAATLVSGPSHGQLTLNANGSFAYTADAGFNGVDTFRYKVSDGYTTSANIATVAVQVGAPLPAAGLTASAGNAQVALNWTRSSSAASYNVGRSTASGGPYTIIANVPASGTGAPSYTDATAANGTTYYYVVSGVNALGAGAGSSEAAARPVQTFAQWAATAFPGQTDALVTGPAADPDGDGVSNLAEYFFGTNPQRGDAAATVVTCTRDGQGNALVGFRQAKGLVGVTCTVQQSADLVFWTDTGVAVTILSDAGSDDLMQAVVPVGTSARRFFRLSIVLAAQ